MNWTQALIVFIVTFVVTYAMVPVSKRLATKLGAIDYPGNRRVNTQPVPRCGGISLYVGLCAGAFTVFLGTRFFGWELSNLYMLEDVNYLLAYVGITLMFAVGLIDDITQLSPWAKFVGQIVAAIVVVAAGVSVDTVRMVISGEYFNLGWLDWPVSVMYLVVFVNIINLIDGLDGLASGMVAIIAASLLFLVIARGSVTLALACVALVAACLAFLRFNFFPASIFMGDSGALLLGLMIGIISVEGVVRTQSFIIMLVPLAIAGVPVVDTMSAIVRRLRGHESIGHADMDHVHHRLLRAGLSQKRSVAVLWLCTAALAITGCAISGSSGIMRWGVLIGLAIVVFVVIWRFGLFGPVLKHHYDGFGKVGPRTPQDTATNASGESEASAQAADSVDTTEAEV